MKKSIVVTAAAALGTGLLVASPAQAMPPTATQTFPVTCDNGVSVVAEVDGRGLPTHSAWVDGRGIAARAFARVESGTVHLAGGTSVQYSQDVPAGFDAGRRGISLTSNPVSLSNTTACHLPDDEFDITLTLTAEDVAYVGIDPVYIGTDAEVVGHGETTVYLGTAQLLARS